MKSEKRQKIIQLLLVYNNRVTFPKNLDNALMQQAMAGAFEDLDLKKFQIALEQLCVGDNFPSITKIRDHVLGQDENTEIMSAEEAFGWTWTHLNGYEKPQLPPVLEKTIEKLGGWFHICNTWTNDREQVIGRNFRDVYNGVKQTVINERKDFVGLQAGKESGSLVVR